MLQDQVNILFVGNPGTGKSTLLNGLLRKAMFISGISRTGSGVTTNLQKITHDGVYYLDTPGLDDDEMRQNCANEINQALKQSGLYYVCFVITLESGRVRPADKTTIKLVLQSAPQIQSNYSIIINKLDSEVYEYYKSNPQVPATFLNRGIPHSTQSIYFIKDKLELQGKSNVVPEFDDDFAEWLRVAPGVAITPEKVTKIAVNEFEQQRIFFEKQIKELKNQLDKQQEEFFNALNEEKLRAEKQHEEVLLQQEQLRQQYSQQIISLQLQLAQARKPAPVSPTHSSRRGGCTIF